MQGAAGFRAFYCGNDICNHKDLSLQMAVSHRGQQRDKPFRDAIRMEAALAEQGEETPAPIGSLRHIARALLNRASTETAAAREIGDRLDGKPAQAIVGGDDEDNPVKQILEIRQTIVDPRDSDCAGISAAALDIKI